MRLGHLDEELKHHTKCGDTVAEKLIDSKLASM